MAEIGQASSGNSVRSFAGKIDTIMARSTVNARTYSSIVKYTLIYCNAVLYTLRYAGTSFLVENFLPPAVKTRHISFYDSTEHSSGGSDYVTWYSSGRLTYGLEILT